MLCADISETSVEHCKGRYNSGKMIDRETGEPPYEAEFIVADLCEVRTVSLMLLTIVLEAASLCCKNLIVSECERIRLCDLCYYANLILRPLPPP